MSDDEELVYVKRARTIHYGSLEESERQRQNALDSAEAAMDTGVPSGGPASTIDYSTLDDEVYEI